MFSFLLGSHLGVKLLSYMVALSLAVKRTTELFSKAAVLLHIPTISVPVFQFLHVLTNSCYGLSLL